jgi:CDP-diacylglycerol--serine O-phosphatidyltransferase
VTETPAAEAGAADGPPPPAPNRSQTRRRRSLHINWLIPNLLTLLALASGLSALRFALEARWELAVLAIVAAGILDGLDGRIARILKGTSRFGAELDSLSDFLCFGVAPALTLYLWTLATAGRFGWLLVLLWCMATALRLARFNADIEATDQPTWARHFFVGMPSPAGAGLVLLPMLIWFETESVFFREPAVVAVVVAGGSCLVVSRIRTFSFKKIRLSPGWVLPAMLIAAAYLALLVSNVWLTLTLTMLAYLASIPVSIRTHQRFLGQGPAAMTPSDTTSTESGGDAWRQPRA